MIDRLRYSMQAMKTITRSQEVVANNLANINTTGFRKDKLFFHALESKVNGQTVSQVSPQQVLSNDQGSFEETGNTWDFAIRGNGYFQVEQNGQLMLSRDGRFQVDADGYLVDSNGGYVQGNAGRIHMPELLQINDEAETAVIDVDQDGTIHLNDRVLDRIRVVGVENSDGLERRGNSYYASTGPGSVYLDGQSLINQGYYETGNVNTLEEMTSMMTNLQMFESQQRAMRTSDEILQQVTTRLGKF